MTGATQAHLRSVITEHRPLIGQILRFMGIGFGSMLLNLAVFVSLDRVLGHQVSNIVALVVGSIVNTALNRRYTFQVRGRGGHAKVQLQNLALLAVTWCCTALALLVLQHLEPHSSTALATVTVAIGNFLATASRFVLLRRWFAPHTTRAEDATLPTL